MFCKVLTNMVVTDRSHTGYRQPIVYNAKVFASLCRQVYQAEKLAPPTNLSTWASAYAHIWARGTNFGWWRETLRSGAWVGVGVVVGLIQPLFDHYADNLPFSHSHLHSIHFLCASR